MPEPEAPQPRSSGPSPAAEPPTAGRAAAALDVSTGDGMAILGVDLGGTQVRVGKVRAGIVERSAASSISSRGSAQVVAGELYRAIDDLFDAEVTGIGCGVPSVVDLERGIVYGVENIPSWQAVPLREQLERRYGVPVHVNNDANAFAVGELYFGAGRGFRHLVGLTLGTGLGAGVVVDGRLYSGANCGAGELGAMPYRGHTIEHYCSGAFFQRVAGIRGEEAFRRAEAGDAAAIELFEQLGHELGHAVMVTLYAYDPELIVLGGSISVALRFFERPMRERLREYPWPHVVERLHIAASAVENAAILGAAALWIDATNGAPG